MSASTSLFTLKPVVPCVLPSTGEHAGSPADLGRAMRCVSVRHTHTLVGTSDGALHYFVSENASWVWRASASVSSAGRPVEKVLLFEELRLVAVLCDHTLTFLTFPDLTPVRSAAQPPIRGVLQVITDEAEVDSGAWTFVSLCVIRRQSLLLGVLDHSSWRVIKDIPLPRDAFIAHRYNESVCLATASEYALVDLESGALQPIGLPISQSTQVSSAKTRPSIVPIPAYGDELPCFLITSHSENGTLGAFVRADGEPTARLLEWPSHPRAVVVDFPYVCALLRNDTIHIHYLPTLSLVETLAIDPACEPRFLVPTAANEHLCDDRPGLPTAPLSPGTAPSTLPSDACARTEPPRVLFGGKRTLQSLARFTPGSAFIRCARAGEWRAAHAHLARATSLDDETRAACILLGLHYLHEGLFVQAAPWLVRGQLDPRLVLCLYPDLAPSAPHTATLPQAAAGLWAALPPSIEALLHEHLAWNYAPDVSLDDPVVRDLHAALMRRAEQMLLQILKASDTRRGDVATALCQLMLQRDATESLAALEPYLDTCDMERTVPMLRRTHRYHALCMLYFRRARPAEAIDLAQQLLGGTVRDEVDGPVPLPALASYAPSLPPAARIDLGLVLARHDRACALHVRVSFSRQVLRDVDFLAVEAAPALRAIQEVDADLAAALLEHVVLSAPLAMQSLHEALLTQYLTADDVPTRTKRQHLLACSPALDERLVDSLEGRPVDQAILLSKVRTPLSHRRVTTSAHLSALYMRTNLRRRSGYVRRAAYSRRGTTRRPAGSGCWPSSLRRPCPLVRACACAAHFSTSIWTPVHRVMHFARRVRPCSTRMRASLPSSRCWPPFRPTGPCRHSLRSSCARCAACSMPGVVRMWLRPPHSSAASTQLSCAGARCARWAAWSRSPHRITCRFAVAGAVRWERAVCHAGTHSWQASMRPCVLPRAMSAVPTLSLTPLESLLCGLLDHACRWMSDVDPQVECEGRTYSFSQLCRPNEPSALRCEARIAGGWVRDKLLQLPSHDLDVSLSTLTGHNFALFLQAYLASDAFAATPLKATMDAHAHGATAISHIGKIAANPEQSKNLETATARVLGLDVDFVNLRKEVYEGGSRIPIMSFGTPYEDAMRRDMTVNALFYNVHTQRVEDWTGHGLDDLRTGLVRTPLEPAATFEDDPLRILRCIRFASRFGYAVHPSIVACLAGTETPEAHTRAETLREALSRKVSRERVGIEVDKMLAGPDPRRALTLLAELHLYPAVFQPPPPMSTQLTTADGSPTHAAPEAPVLVISAFFDSMLRSTEAYASLYTRLPTSWLAHLRDGRNARAVQRLLWYCIALLPLRGLRVPQGKHTVWAGVATMAVGLKLGHRTTKDPVRNLYEAADLLHDPSLERFAPEGVLSRRARIGLLLRHSSITSPALEVSLPNALMAALLVELVALVDGPDLRRDDAARVLDTYAAFWTYVETEGLAAYAQSKPIVDGQRIAEALGCEKHLISRLLPFAVAWEIDHEHVAPAERVEQCVRDLQAAWNDGELVPEAERSRVVKRSK